MTMSKKAFDKIADGLTDAIGLAKSGALEVPHKAGETLIVDNEKKVVARVTMRPVPTDKGIEGLAEIAQQALSVDYAGTKSAIAAAQTALRKVIRKSTQDGPVWAQETIEQSHGPKIDFTGRVLAANEFTSKSETNPMHVTMKVWQTKGGALIARLTTEPTYGDGYLSVRAEVVEPTDDVQAMWFAVMDFFDWTEGARSMARKMGWNLRRDVD